MQTITLCRQVTNLLSELAFRHRLTTELDVECVCARQTRSVQNAHSPVAVVNYVNVDVTSARAANVARHVTVASVGSVNIDDTFLADRYCRSYSICRKQVNK